MDDYKYINLDYLNSFGTLAEHMKLEMISVFFDSTPKLLSELETSILKSHWVEVGRIAHKLKTNIDTMGIGSCKQLIRDFESAGLSGGKVDYDQFIYLKTQMEYATEELRHELHIIQGVA